MYFQPAAAAVIISLIAAQAPPAAQADAAIGCHLVRNVGVGCLDPNNAAEAFHAFGFSRTKIIADYTRAYLQDRGCGAFADSSKNPKYFRYVYTNKLMRVATPEGWVDLRFLITRGADGHEYQVYIADDYLTGVCEGP